MATTARLGIDITATDRTRAAFASSQRSLQTIERTVRQLKGAFAGIIGGNVLSGFIRSLIEVNRHTEPVKSAITTLQRAWQAFALQVGNSGLNEALVTFIQRISEIIVGSGRLSDSLGKVLAGVLNAVRRGFEGLARVVGFAYDNFETLKKVIIVFMAIQVAQRVISIAMAFVKMVAALRAATFASAAFHIVQKRSVILWLAVIAIVAKLTGTYDVLVEKINQVVQWTEGLFPSAIDATVKALKMMGLDVTSLTEDFSKFGDKLKNLPATFDELDKAAKSPFNQAKIDLDQYIQGLRDQTAAVGMSEGALARLAQSQDVYNKLQDRGVKLSKDQRAEIEQRLDQIPDLVQKLNIQKNNLQVLQDAGQAVSEAFTSGLTAIADRTKTVADAVQDMVKSIVSSLAQLLVNQAFTTLLNGPGGSGGALGGAFGALFGGPRAAGGPVSAGKYYMVGEQGPELFAPGTNGAIIPNRGGSGGFTKVVVNNYGGHVQQRESQGPGGERMLELQFNAMFDKRLGSQKTARTLNQGYGLRPRQTVR